jgi:hypothetical protein
VPLALLREAAFCPIGDGTFRFDWRDERARSIVALGLVILRLAKTTRRRSMWGRVVRGLTRECLCALIARRHDDPPSLSVLSHTWYRDEHFHLWECGYLVALHETGFLYKQQLPAHASSVAPWERYPDRNGVLRTSNRYWVRDRVAAAHDRSSSEQDDAALHEIGWNFPDERLSRQLRTAAARRWAERRREALERACGPGS